MRRFAIVLAPLAATITLAGAKAQMAAPIAPAQPPAPTASADDPFLWIEDIDGPRAVDWVKGENARSEKILTADPRYAGMLRDATAIEASTDRIPAPHFIGRMVYNFWQDGEHKRGVWRRTTAEDFATPSPHWETVIDLDALAAAEHAQWIWKEPVCRSPGHDRCLIALSDGGKDAVELREFDLKTKTFVKGGFRLPTSKQTVDWLDDDTLILTRDFGPGTTTQSGYGFVVKTLHRGQPLSAAKTIFTGSPKDVSADPEVLTDASGHRLAVIRHAVGFFDTRYLVLGADGRLTPLDLPLKSTLHGYVDGQLIITLEEPWTYRGRAFASGSLLAATPAKLLPAPAKGKDELVISNACDPCVLIAPGPRQSVDQVGVTAHRVVAAVYDNVRGRMVSFQYHGEWGWKQASLPGADNSSVGIASTSDVDDRVFYTVEGFLEPSRLYLADAAGGDGRAVKSLPAQFDASKDTVEQFEATSKDGTKIPYFVIRPKDLKLDGSAPAIQFAYGGFALSKPPVYNAELGKLWLERGGVYIHANIRGGGEFGPAWHDATKGPRHQNAFDDFFAVSEDAIKRGITSPRRLGAYGRSNGGLLMGGVFTQRPELYTAVVIESPLLDMLRYHKLSAGASWIGEYGDPDKPEERAWIQGYSPYQKLRAGVKYPVPYISASRKDDRVHPGHARKFAAKLQALGDPFLFYETQDGGHANSADPVAAASRWARHYTYYAMRLMD